MPSIAPSFGNSQLGVPSPIPEDDVRVYAQSMEMSLADARATRHDFGRDDLMTFDGRRARSLESPPLSPSPYPLRGYASKPLGAPDSSLPATAASDAAADRC